MWIRNTCKLLGICCTVPCILMLSALGNEDGLYISEVMYNPLGSDTGAEYVELVNVSSVEIDLSGYDLDAADLPYFSMPDGTVLDAKSTLRIYFRSNGLSLGHEIYTGSTFGSSNMSNTKGAVALFRDGIHDGEHLIDYVAYGDAAVTHVDRAIEVGLWGLGEFLFGADEGESLHRVCEDHLVECWESTVDNGNDSFLLEDAVQSMDMSTWLEYNTQIVEEESLRSYVDDILTLHSSSGTLLSYHIGDEQWQETEQKSVELSLPLGEHKIEYYTSSGIVLSPMITKQVTVMEYPYIELDELSFVAGDDEEDFLEFTVYDNGGNLGDLYIQIDETIVSLPELELSLGDKIVVIFGEDSSFVPQMDGVYSVSVPQIDNLVSTTEQVILYARNGTPVAGVCWTNGSPTDLEFDEQQHFLGLAIASVSSCLDSKNIKKGESFHVVQNKWVKYTLTTPGEDTPQETNNNNNTNNTGSVGTSTGEKTDDCSYPNGLYINEVFPNPKGADAGHEWIELYNDTDQELILCDITVDDEQGGAGPFDISGLRIAEKGYLILEGDTLPVTLNNNEDQVRLFFQEELLSEVVYDGAIEGKSYGRITK